MSGYEDINNEYCNAITFQGKMCGNHIHEGGKCFIHRTSRCDAITRRGKRCKNASFVDCKCHSHLPKTLKDRIQKLNDIEDKKEAEEQTPNAKPSIMFDLSSNQTKIVSRYIHTLEKWDDGSYIYDFEIEEL